MVIDEGYFVKYLKNELTEEETRKLVAWVKEKREHGDFLFSLKEAYTYLNYEKDRKEADTEREWHRFVKQEGLPTCPEAGHRVGWSHWLSYAAVALLCLLVGWQLNRLYIDRADTGVPTTLETEVGQQAKASLPDGSTVQLNACSHFGVDKSEVLYCGDSTIDAEAAKNAGVDFAAVTTGNTTRAEFEAYPHVAILDALSPDYLA